MQTRNSEPTEHQNTVSTIRLRLTGIFSHPDVVLAARIIIGIIFLISAGAKLAHPDAFVHAVQAYGILPEIAVRPLAMTFPWIELIVGAVLLLGVFTQLAASVAAIMMLGFIALLSLAMLSGKNIDCGCFVGLIEEMVGAEAIVRDVIMLVLLVPVLSSSTHLFSLDSIMKKRHAGFPRQLALAIAVAIVVVVLGFGFTALVAKSQPANAAAVPTVTGSVRPASGWRLGPESSKVTVIVYSDFQCSSCKEIDAILKLLVKDYNGQVSVVYRAFPLKVHAYSLGAAEAAEAAGEQGKFWEMHDALFDNQDRLNPEIIRTLAQQIGLDMNRYDASIASGRPMAIVDADRASGDALGITFTPYIIVGGEVFNGEIVGDLKTMIDNKL